MTTVGSFGAASATNVDTPGVSARQRHLPGICAVLLIGSICTVDAQQRQTVATPAPIEFHIAAQPLASALQAYGERTGVQVLYESNSAIGRKSVSVEGNLTHGNNADFLMPPSASRSMAARSLS